MSNNIWPGVEIFNRSMCQNNSIESTLGTVFQANITQTEQNNSIDKIKHLIICVCCDCACSTCTYFILLAMGGRYAKQTVFHIFFCYNLPIGWSKLSVLNVAYHILVRPANSSGMCRGYSCAISFASMHLGTRNKKEDRSNL